MECLQKNMSELAVWLFGIREQCPDLSESAKIGVVVMFSTLFLIVLTFVVVLKRRMAIIEVCFSHEIEIIIFISDRLCCLNKYLQFGNMDCIQIERDVC